MTIESSFHGFLNDERETKIFTESNLQLFGQKFCQSILEYSLILEENQRQKIELAKKLSKKRKQKKRKTIREIMNLNKSQARINRKTETKNLKSKSGFSNEENIKLKSPHKRGNKNNSRADRSMKINPKKLSKNRINLLPSLKFESKKKSNFNQLKTRIKEESSPSNLLNISDEMEEPCFSAHKKENKENKFFKIITTDSK